MGFFFNNRRRDYVTFFSKRSVVESSTVSNFCDMPSLFVFYFETCCFACTSVVSEQGDCRQWRLYFMFTVNHNSYLRVLVQSKCVYMCLRKEITKI